MKIPPIGDRATLSKMLEDLNPKDREEALIWMDLFRKLVHTGGRIAGVAYALLGAELSDQMENDLRGKKDESQH